MKKSNLFGCIVFLLPAPALAGTGSKVLCALAGILLLSGAPQTGVPAPETASLSLNACPYAHLTSASNPAFDPKMSSSIPVPAPHALQGAADFRAPTPLTLTTPPGTSSADASLASAPPFAQPHYIPINQTLSGKEKQRALYHNIIQEPYDELPTQSSSLAKLNLFNPYYSKQSFDSVADEMPEGREHVIHTFGVAGKVQFVADPDSEFSGIFHTGAPGIIRMSTAVMRATKQDALIPGIAVKFLIDRKKSENTVAMFGLAGQGPDSDFFKEAFRTTVDKPKSWGLSIGSFFFKLGIWTLDSSIRPENERTLPVDRIAAIRADGTEVTDTEVRAPYELLFTPSDQVRGKIASEDERDFRIPLSQIKKGTLLYHVSARREDSDFTPVGKLILRSRLVASKYADRLFFQHQTRRVRSVIHTP